MNIIKRLCIGILILLSIFTLIILLNTHFQTKSENDFNQKPHERVLSKEEIDEFNAKEEQKKLEQQKAQEALNAQQQQEEQQRQQLYYQQSQPKSNGSGLTKSGGVNYFNGMRETYYSSRILYHHLTPQWTLDNEGFYHDSNGYYVVSCNHADHAHGEVFQTSKGASIVLDTGCAQGTVDFYVNW